MIIDVILDRYDGDAYDPKEFYDSMMAYEEGTDYPISRAMDSGEEEDIRRELCAYIDDSNYNPKIKDFINSVAWLEPDDGKDYSKEMDILGESKKHTCSMSKKKESLAKKKEANSEEYITDWQADIIKGLEKVKDKYGLVIEYNGPFSDEWKEYPTYSVFVLKGGKKEDIGTVGTDYVHAFVDYTSPGMNVSSPHYAKDYSAEEAIQAILNSAKMCLGKKGEAKKNEGAGDTIKVTAENVMLTVNDVYVDEHGGSFSVETPEEGKSYNLLDMQEMIRGMCEDCTGYANYSRDGSELFIEVMAGEMDDNGEWTGDYYKAYSFRCIARILSYSLEGIIDFLDESN